MTPLYKYSCTKCNYFTNNKTKFERHLSTKKHNNIEMSINKCEICGKKFKYISGLSRHKSRCINRLEKLQEKNKELVESFNNMIEKVNGSINNSVINNNSNNNTITNCNNKVVNVQLFLNEECKEAISIQKFANNLVVKLDDLTDVKEENIKNVVLDNLKPLSITQRPFHCTNEKKKEWYVKDDVEGWEENNGDKILESATISMVTKLGLIMKEESPDWMLDEKLQNKYLDLLQVMPKKVKTELLKKISDMVLLEYENEV